MRVYLRAILRPGNPVLGCLSQTGSLRVRRRSCLILKGPTDIPNYDPRGPCANIVWALYFYSASIIIVRALGSCIRNHGCGLVEYSSFWRLDPPAEVSREAAVGIAGVMMVL